MAYKRKLLYMVLCVCFISMYAGLADYDWYWQCELGKAVVTEGNFNAVYDLVWGTKGVAEYLDHEWLTNVMFYICSLIGYRGISVAKMLICIVYAVCTSKYLEFLTLEACETYSIDFRPPDVTWVLSMGLPVQEYNDTALAGIFGYLFIMSTVFIKPKAYILSVAFLLIEVHILHLYKIRAWDKRYFVKMLILLIVWNNMHSGSVPLFFLVAGIYWLTDLGRSKKVLQWLPVYVLGLCINPYGPRLILFDISHNFDPVMKQIILDWKGIDAKEALGVICVAVVLGVVFFLRDVDWKTHKFDVIMTVIVLFMSFQSARHLIYLAPFIYPIMRDNTYKFKARHDVKEVLAVVLIGFAVLSVVSGFGAKNYNKTYAMQYMEPELVEILQETNSESSDGLYATDIALWEYGLKQFTSGAFPSIRERRLAEYELTWSASDARISEIIGEYGLTKFLAVKYNPAVPFADRNGVLYDYLTAHDEYELMYDSDFYYYFVRKDLL